MATKFVVVGKVGLKMKIKFYDTNILLHNDINKIEDKIYVSSVTLQELESIKTSSNKDSEVKYQARIATRWFMENEDKYECIVVEKKHHDILKDKELDEDNDNLIIACAYLLGKENVEFYTNDMCCYNIAKNIFGLECKNLGKYEKKDYTGYIELKLSPEEINELYSEYSNGINKLRLLENQYLLITNTFDNKQIEYKYVDGKLEMLKLPPSKVIKGLNSKQRCALDLLNNPNIPIKVIAGTYGSGKTMLTARSAIYQLKEKGFYSKILLVRNPIGSGEACGFLPGTFEEKTKDFYAPIEQNLEGGEFELQGMKTKGELDCQIPYYMKGMSLNETFVICDECEDLDRKTFKLVGTRIGKNSCVAFVGDWKQAENKFTRDNGLTQFIDFAKGNKLVGIVVLDDDVRSDASKVFCDFD